MEFQIQPQNGLPRSQFCRFTPDRYVVITPDGQREVYDIALSDLQAADRLAYWIRQITPKLWATPDVLADFAAFASVLILCPPPEM